MHVELLHIPCRQCATAGMGAAPASVCQRHQGTEITCQVQDGMGGLLPPGSIDVGLAAETCQVMDLAHLQCGLGLSALTGITLRGMHGLPTCRGMVLTVSEMSSSSCTVPAEGLS